MSISDDANIIYFYGSERYALAILRPLQDAIRARGHKAAWFFDGPGGEELRADETFLRHARRKCASSIP